MTSLWEIQEDEAARLMQDDRQQEVVAIPPADWERHHTAVAAMIEREAALTERVDRLVIERDVAQAMLKRNSEQFAEREAALAARVAELEADAVELRKAYGKARNSAAGYSNYCDDNANTRRCERDLDEAERIYRAIDSSRAEARDG